MVFASVRNQLRRLRRDERGAVAVIMGLLIVPFMGFLALGFEVSNWYLITRGMQNAADASVLAAAINNSANYSTEANAVAALYGFVNGTNNVTIAVTNTAACPSGGNNCYSVTISGYTPLLVSQIVGYQGNANLNRTLEKRLSAVAVAKPSIQPQDLCLLALATSGVAQGISTNGAPTGNMNGCDSMSNTGANCSGHDLGLGISFAYQANTGCGAQQMQNNPIADPYSYLASNIPPLSSSGCNNTYPQETHQGNHYSVAASNQLTGTLNLTAGNHFLCGDQMLTGNVTVNAPAGAVLIIENGQLDTNGYSFATSSGSGLTVVFSGTNGSYTHAPTDNVNGAGGALNITAPTSGTWSGVAIYQDPSLTTGVSVSAAGNTPTWDITGLIYMPHGTLTLKGAIDKSNFGHQCVVMVADNFQISGTGGIMKTDIGECQQAGLTMPTAVIPGGAKLVL
jgi:Flp pilus assembly protein TadG